MSETKLIELKLNQIINFLKPGVEYEDFNKKFKKLFFSYFFSNL